MNIDDLLEELYAYSMFSIRLGLDNIKEICKYLEIHKIHIKLYI